MQWGLGTSSDPFFSPDRPPVCVLISARSGVLPLDIPAEPALPGRKKTWASQWGSQQEPNFFCSLKDRFSLWASLGAIAVTVIYSIPCLHAVIHAALQSWISLMLVLPCTRLWFLENLSLSVRFDWYHLGSPCSWITFQGAVLLEFQMVGDFFLYVTESTGGHDSIVLLQNIQHITTQWGHVYVFPEKISFTFLAYGSISTIFVSSSVFPDVS